jgi:molybdenum cofactor cytidylyltransferase
MAELPIAALVLAAGRAQRFGAGPNETKLLATVDDQPLVRLVAATVLRSGAHPIYVVTGHAAGSVVAALDGLPLDFIHNEAHASGLSTSLQRGLAALGPAPAGVLVCLGDMPRVRAETLKALMTAFGHVQGQADAILPCQGGRIGNPVLLGRRLFRELDRLQGDEGARRLLDSPGRETILCEVVDPGIFLDIDTPAALAAVRDSL